MVRSYALPDCPYPVIEGFRQVERPIKDLEHGFEAKFEQELQHQGLVSLVFAGRHNGGSAFRIRTIRS